MNYRVISIKTVKTEREGSLSFFEGEKDIAFAIKRIYYIHNVPQGIERGMHAHKKLRQLLFCPYGSITIMLTDGTERVSVLLDNPEKGLYLEPGIWRNMIWNEKNSVLCVAASEYYDENDYIRDYEEYLLYMKTTRI